MTNTNMEATIDKEYWLGQLKRYLDHQFASSRDDRMNDQEVKEFEEHILKRDVVDDAELALIHKMVKGSGKEYIFVIVFNELCPVEVYPLFDLYPSGYNIHGYSHMDKETQRHQVGIPIPEIVRQLSKINYGHQRTLAHIVKQREKSPAYFRFPEHRRHTDNLRKLLESGWY